MLACSSAADNYAHGNSAEQVKLSFKNHMGTILVCSMAEQTEAAPTSPILCVQAADCTVCLAPTSLNDVIERELVCSNPAK